MPRTYRRRTNYRRRGRRYPTSRWRIYGRAAAQLASDVYKLKQLVNTEHKYHDVMSATTHSWSGTFSTLNSIAQGSQNDQRNGNSIKLMNLSIKGEIIKSGSANDTQVRVIIIWDQQNWMNAVTQYLQTGASPPGPYIGTAYAPFAPKDFDLRFDCKTLYDKVFIVNDDYQSRLLNIYIKFAHKKANQNHTNYEGTASTINTGALHMIIISNEGTNLPTVRYNARLTYIDN